MPRFATGRALGLGVVAVLFGSLSAGQTQDVQEEPPGTFSEQVSVDYVLVPVVVKGKRGVIG